MSPPQPPDLTIPASSLPSITVLRQELDYGDPHTARYIAFVDDVRSFRRIFSTSTGILADDLHDWKSEVHQAGLTEMTMAFLERDGNGPKFWPDYEASSNYNKWQYSKHRER